MKKFSLGSTAPTPRTLGSLKPGDVFFPDGYGRGSGHPHMVVLTHEYLRLKRLDGGTDETRRGFISLETGELWRMDPSDPREVTLLDATLEVK